MKKKKISSNGFTVIELLSVIVIIGLLLMLAVTSVSSYINSSRKKTVVTSIEEYITSTTMEVNNRKFSFRGDNIIYALPIECVPLDRFGKDPYGEWHQANDDYWAYVLVQYDKENKEYIYGFIFKDSAGYGMYPTSLENLEKNGSQVLSGVVMKQPETNVSYEYVTKNWENSGFIINTTTKFKVLKGAKKGDGVNYCTVYHGNAEGEYGDEEEEIEEIENDYLMHAGDITNADFTFLRTSIKRSDIEEVTLVDSREVPEDVISSWDVSATENGSIMAWIKDIDKDELYEMYIGENGGVQFNPDSMRLFAFLHNATKIDLEKADTSKLTIATAMFHTCSSLETLKGLNQMDFSNVTTTKAMFYDCFKLYYIDDQEGIFKLNWDISNVNTFTSMFYSCESLKEIDFSILATKEEYRPINIVRMDFMFCGGKDIVTFEHHYMSLTNITGLEYFDVSNVTDMKSMFWNCINLKTLNLSNWNTENVSNMGWMFGSFNCNMMLENVNGLDEFNTSKVAKMTAMFQGANKLTTDLSGWDFGQVREIGYFLYTDSAVSMETVLNFNFNFPDSLVYTMALSTAKNITINYTENNESVVDAMLTYTTGYQKGCKIEKTNDGYACVE